MSNYLSHFEKHVQQIKAEGRYRQFTELERKVGEFPYAVNHSHEDDNIKLWCSNDYLGMGQHPKVIEAVVNTAKTMGAGAGGTRNIAGNHSAVVALEAELADWHNKENSLVFASGYIANQTCLATLAQILPDPVFFSDQYNHASMIEGIRHSRARKEIFAHNNVNHLRELLAKYPCLLYTSPSPRDKKQSRMPSSA